MAYCLRLPPDAVALIDEMRRHWVDLAGLRAAGGAPLARCVKGFEITSVGDGSVFVKAWIPRRDGDHVRVCDYGIADFGRRCRAALTTFGDYPPCGRCRNRPVHVKAPENLFAVPQYSQDRRLL